MMNCILNINLCSSFTIIISNVDTCSHGRVSILRGWDMITISLCGANGWELSSALKFYTGGGVVNGGWVDQEVGQ